jgi:phage tail sheath protein FI
MAERIVSPGVFTQERDLSFLEQGIAEIGGAFVGPTAKGPAFIPTVVRSANDYIRTFGEADASSYMGYTVKNYLQEAGSATVVRVLGLNGYSGSVTRPAFLYATGSAGKYLFAVLHPTQTGASIIGATATGNTGSFSLVLTSSLGVSASQTGLSSNAASTGYIQQYLGTEPTGDKIAYLYSFFPNAATVAGTGSSVSFVVEAPTIVGSAATQLNFAGTQYNNASTPWIQSQTVGGSKIDLFKVHTLGDGIAANRDIKVSVLAIKPDTLDATNNYGTFSLLIRKFTDTDTNVEVLEQWDNLTLDANSPDFIARRIGTSEAIYDSDTLETYYSGEFRNNSNYIRIEMADSVIPPNALPYGFGKVFAPAALAEAVFITGSVVSTRWADGAIAGWSATASDTKAFYGWEFSDTNVTNLSYLNATPSGSALIGTAFNIENLPATEANGAQISLTNTSHLRYRRFTVPFQGGFDGLNPARQIFTGTDITSANSQGFNLASSITNGSLAYKRALDAVRNPDAIDINLLVLPGVIYELHSYVATTALELCEERQDCFYIMDLTGYSSTVDTAVNKASEIDSNYTAVYYPWVKVIDTNTNKFIWAPPSVVLPEVFAYNDNVAAEWFAPAGLNRGSIEGAVGLAKRLNLAGRDTLYEGKVNPIATFPGQGICVWGQKTLQRRKSALDRVNVRRLMIAVKKYIASASRYLVFEQNVEATRNRFLNIVNPYLASIQERSGLYAFRVVMDETNNTPDVIDRNFLVGQLYLQPTKTSEFISLEFNILPTGAIFPGA